MSHQTDLVADEYLDDERSALSTFRCTGTAFRLPELGPVASGSDDGAKGSAVTQGESK
jgi:hypothetical protein